MIRQDVVDAARTELGTTWRHQARRPGVALDCLGLVVATANKLGLEPEDCTTYRRQPDPVRLQRMTSEQLVLADKDALKPGMVILLRFEGRNTNPYHFAIVTGPTTMIHGYAIARKVVEEDIERWRPSIVRAFDFPGVTD
jgi:cell wall-associated NlpC family hydrolase